MVGEKSLTKSASRFPLELRTKTLTLKIKEEFHKEILHRRFLVDNLLVARMRAGALWSQFQTVQCALPGQRATSVFFVYPILTGRVLPF